MFATLYRATIQVLACCALALLAPARAQEGSVSEAVALAAGGQASSDSASEGLSSADWDGLHAAYQTERHAARCTGAGYRAHNARQDWRLLFDHRGFNVEPSDGGWTWGLDLESYGFAHHGREVLRPQVVEAHGRKVSYKWDCFVEEWYVNHDRGLEHGYTVFTRPPKGDVEQIEPLTFSLRVRGGLVPEVTEDGRTIRFTDAAGVSALLYEGLHVFDADGQDLEASFSWERDRLILRIYEGGARYPITIDPLAQQALLKASNVGAGDNFGYSVAISGDTAVIGAYQEDSSATGINGNGADNSSADSGAAYVFVRSGTTWAQQAYLKASNTEADDWFGFAVDLSAETAVVSAPRESSNATGVNGNQANNAAFWSGAAYVFVRNGTTWSQQAYLKASNTDITDFFGWSVSISGDTIAVGASDEDSNATGVNGNQASNSAGESGAAYVFVRSGTAWAQQAYLKASNTDQNDFFGTDLAVSDNTIVVGANGEDSNATGVNGNQSDNSAGSAGAAYVFTRSGTVWTQEAYLKASNTYGSSAFGISADVSGDTAVVGSPREFSNSTGVNGDQYGWSPPLSCSGASYVFRRSGTTWSQEAYLKASNTGASDEFGWDVATSGDTVIVTAPWEDSDATGVNFDQCNNNAASSGAAYVFVRTGTAWAQEAYLKASNTAPQGGFASSVGVSGTTIIVGAAGEDGATSNEGAGYIFDIVSPPGTALCFGDGTGTSCPCANDSSTAGEGCLHSGGIGMTITGSGTTSITADDLVVTANQAPLGNNGQLYCGTTNGSPGTTLYDGLQCVGGSSLRFRSLCQVSGAISDTGFVAQDLSGTFFVASSTYYFQYWSRDPMGPCGSGANFSPALAVTMTP